MSKIEVVGLGALNMDHLYQVERILDDGEVVVKESVLSPGGSSANTIYGLAKLGVNTGFTGIVGDDIEGEMLLHDFQEAGVDTSQIKIKTNVKSGSVLCLSDKHGGRSLYVSPGANNLLTIDDLDLTYIDRAEMLHVSSFADDRQFKVLLELVERLNLSIRLSFAPGALYAARGLKALSPVLARSHVLFINQNEIQELTCVDRRLLLVSVGGTFDVLHKGHWFLLEEAFNVGDSVVIGLSTDEFAQRLKKPHKIDCYEKRLQDLRTFLEERGLEKRAEIVPLNDPYGPTIESDEIEGIVVSEETEPRAEEINGLRVARGRRPLLIIVITMVLAEDGKPITSTRIRRQEVDRYGKLIG